MVRFPSFLAVLASLISLSLAGLLIRDNVRIDEFVVRRDETSTITFPIRRALPPVLRGLKLVHADGNVTAVAPFLGTNGTVSTEDRAAGGITVRIAFSVQRIRVRLDVPDFDLDSSSFRVSGRAFHTFRRPFGLRLRRSRRSSVPASIGAARRALKSGDLNVSLITTFSHARNAASVGMRLAASTLIVFGSPRIGAPLWLRRPAVGIEIPLEVLVASSPLGIFYVAWNTASLLRWRLGFTPADNEALDLMDASVTQVASIAANRNFRTPRRRFDFNSISQRGLRTRTRMTRGDTREGFRNLVQAIKESENLNIAYTFNHDDFAIDGEFSEADGRTNRVAVFANPAFGTSVIQSAFTVAIDLPLKVGVFDRRPRPSRYSAGFVTPSYIQRRHGVQLPAESKTVLETLVDVALGEDSMGMPEDPGEEGMPE